MAARSGLPGPGRRLTFLTFGVIVNPGTFGDDRAYLIRRGLVRAMYPYPTTPIELDAFRAVVAEEMAKPDPPLESMASQGMDEMLLVMSWFRRHPDSFRRTTRLAEWGQRDVH